jgi:predicted permease
MITARGWYACSRIYRVLVVGQTLAWAASSLIMIVAHRHREPLSAHPIGIALLVATLVAIVAGLFSYYRRRPQPHDRDAVILAWVWFQTAGFLAFAAYLLTGAVICFLVGVGTLALMHAFSPNRFQTHPNA